MNGRFKVRADPQLVGRPLPRGAREVLQAQDDHVCAGCCGSIALPAHRAEWVMKRSPGASCVAPEGDGPVYVAMLVPYNDPDQNCCASG